MKSNAAFKIRFEKDWFQNKDILEVEGSNNVEVTVIKTPSKLSLFFKKFFRIITFGLYKPNYDYWVMPYNKEEWNKEFVNKTYERMNYEQIVKKQQGRSYWPPDPTLYVPQINKKQSNITGETN